MREVENQIIVIGDIIVDTYVSGFCARISPEAPVQVVNKEAEGYLLGGAGNVAVNLASIGGSCKLISIVGSDQTSLIVHDLISKIKNLEFFPVVSNRVTTSKTRIVVDGQQLLRLDEEDKHEINEKEVFSIISILEDNLRSKLVKLVVISDYNKGMLSAELLDRVFKLCRKYNVVTFLDPKVRNFEKYYGVDLIKPNEREAIESCSFDIDRISISNDKILLRVAKEIHQKSGSKHVLITLSSQGSVLIDTQTLKIVKALSKKVDVYDVTGAGDTFISVFSWLYVRGVNLSKCLICANRASSVSVKKRGNYIITKEDMTNIGKECDFDFSSI